MKWCNGSTTDFGSVSPGSSPGFTTIHYINLNYMSFRKSFVATVSSEDMEELLRTLFGGSVETPKHPKTFSHPALVRVKAGDGIGFNMDNCVIVTNAKNNVGMLMKANYKEPFQQHKSLVVSKEAVCNKKDLVPGHTYIVYDDDDYAFVKYLGHSLAIVRCQHDCDAFIIKQNRIPPHYELSIPVES